MGKSQCCVRLSGVLGESVHYFALSGVIAGLSAVSRVVGQSEYCVMLPLGEVVGLDTVLCDQVSLVDLDTVLHSVTSE